MSDIIVGKNSCIEALRSGRKIHSITMLSPGGGKSVGSGRKSMESRKSKVSGQQIAGGGKSGASGRKSTGSRTSGGPKRGSGSAGDVTDEIVAFAKERGIPIEYVDRATLDRMAGGANHQGVVASAQEYSYSSIDEIVAFAKEKGEALFLILLDRIEDPHNLGAIIRTAECAGAHGVIIPRNRAAAVNETVLKTSAGAAEHIRCARVTNMSRTIDELKERGVWVYACDMGESEVWDTDMSGAVAIVIGSEGKGVSRLVKERCDGTISMPLAGKVGSLNASNAAAIAMYEVVRQRRKK